MNILGLGKQIAPWLNRAMPAMLGIKGLGRVNPKISSFIQSALTVGYSADNIMDYIRSTTLPTGERVEEERLKSGEAKGTLTPTDERSLATRESQQAPAKALGSILGLAGGISGAMNTDEDNMPPEMENAPAQPPPPQNISPYEQIAQLSPELSKFIEQHLSQGRSPEEAAALAKIMDKYKKHIKQIEKKTGSNFVDYVVSLFGSQAQPPQANTQMQAQPQENDQLMEAIQKILKM